MHEVVLFHLLAYILPSSEKVTQLNFFNRAAVSCGRGSGKGNLLDNTWVKGRRASRLFLNDNLAWTIGAHELRFGTNTRVFRLNDYDFGDGAGLLGVGLGGDSSARMIAFQARLEF